MKLTKTGGRLRKLRKTIKKKKKKEPKRKCFNSLLNVANKVIKKKKLTGSSILAAVKSAKQFKKQNNISLPRVIPIPKTGGVLPLIPIFAGLSALGALSGGISNIIKNVKDVNIAKSVLAEKKRHNQNMEAIAIGKKGSGLYLKPYKQGYGLYLRPYSKNY